MALDYWAHYYEAARIAGKGEVIEDDDFDLEQIVQEAERRGEERALTDGGWDTVDEWQADQA